MSSQSRRDQGWLRLLTSVDLHAPRGLQFRGQLLTPGAVFELGSLPRPSVILECAGSVRIAAARSRYSFQTLWVLWRFDFERCEWTEIARTTSRDSGWSVDFAPLAWQHLHVIRDENVDLLAAPAVDRLRAVIAGELGELTSEVRCRVLAQLDHFIAGEIIRAADPISVARRGSSYPRIGAHLLGGSGDLRPRAHW